ncbi:heparinase II/III family protein [Desulfomonile tiedjei]|uniref:Heparinase II/III-like protein n=1 Tax=Desulfomonile tiedjei (strain ATCC 49306 / DSM 6799 / DCB-1) TaxID=706587 RepID=I4CC74_DESTA|nr:heparinase II/III family protein [Desulfomonile tiedjei]AFM27165.1 Heparinase II/III-like protein [Desulfomonile tiedjei DSM 6799]
MRDPDLPDAHFRRDRILSRTCIDFEIIDSPAKGASSAGAFSVSATGILSFTIEPASTDFSGFDTLSVNLQNTSQDTVLVGLRLFHGTQTLSESVSFSGGREELLPGIPAFLKFPIESFGTYGEATDWKDVRRITFVFCREKQYAGSEPVSIVFRGLEGESRERYSGPRLTSEGLRHLRQDCSIENACDAKVLSLYRQSNPAMWIPPPHRYPKENADQVLRGEIMGFHLGYPVDWASNPEGSLEWAHFLHRHHFLRSLVIGCAETGNPAYSRALENIVKDWIAANPVPIGSNGGASPAWETLSVAWRLREWLWVAGATDAFHGFRPESQELILRSVWEHARSLVDHQGHSNNWIVVESAALALAGLCFPGFRDARSWWKSGIRRLAIEFVRQFFRDGVHFEISPMYHAICFHALLEVREAAQKAGEQLPEIFFDPLERCGEYLAGLCRPDFTWPSLNDSGSMDKDYTALLRKAGDMFSRPDLQWIGTRGTEGRTPESGLRVFPDAGIAVMRSAYEPDAHFAVFRAGPAGASHVHEDVLSLEITAWGRPILVDPGITSYGPEALTEHYRSGPAHNAILPKKGFLRSKAPFETRVRPAGRNLSTEAGKNWRSVTGICRFGESGDRQSTITRTILFIDSTFWLVKDTVRCSLPEDIIVCWQFAPGRLEISGQSLEFRCPEPEERLFKLIPLLGKMSANLRCLTGSLNPPGGWVSTHGGDVPAPSCEYSMQFAAGESSVYWALIPGLGVIQTERNDCNEGDTIRISLLDFRYELRFSRDGRLYCCRVSGYS